MGIIRAIRQTIGGTLADQWLEVIEPENMGDQTVLTAGIRTGKGANRKGGKDSISNGSVIHVYEGQFMMLLDGGRIVDYSAEPGYFTVDNSSMPSMFSGSLDDVVKNSFDRFRFGGTAPTSQKVLYLNLQEIKGIRFGTRNPISYFDNFYNAELFLRAHGTYSIRITDPIRFYVEAIPKNKDQVEITDINEQYLYESWMHCSLPSIRCQQMVGGSPMCSQRAGNCQNIWQETLDGRLETDQRYGDPGGSYREPVLR